MLRSLSIYVLVLTMICVHGQNISPVPMSFHTAKDKSVTQVWYAPNTTSGTVGKYHKVEVGFKLNDKVESEILRFIQGKGRGINPFDPDEIDFSIKLIAPSGEIIHTHGFYYSPFIEDSRNDKWIEDTTSFHWRMRFAPDEIGKWDVVVQVKTQSYPLVKTSFDFECTTSDHKGVLEISKTGTNADRYLFQSETGKTFVPIGHNITTRGEDVTPSKNNLHLKWINELGANGGNFYRMELPAGGALPDWPTWPYDTTSYHAVNDYSAKLGYMYGYDEVVELSALLEMYFIMFRHHVEVGGQANWGNWDCWANNPYKTFYNLGNSTEEYFKNEKIMKSQKNTLRYIMARWGYSPSFSFYGYSEVDHWTGQIRLDPNESFDLFANWFVEMKSYINDSTHFLGNMFVNSFTSNMPLARVEKSKKSSRLITESDIIAIHAYNQEKWANYKTRYNFIKDFSREWNGEKPVIIEEIGVQTTDVYCCTGINFHNSIWSTIFMGSMGTGLHWYWDRGIHDKAYYLDYNNLAAFFKNENLREGNYTQQRWKNDARLDMKNATIENFALKLENKEKVLGWVHNASYYWRNINNVNTCLQELIDSGKVTNPCLLEDKSPALGSVINSSNNYSDPNFLDNYSDDIGAHTIDDPQFVIKGLKSNGNRVYNPFAKKHWYKISFFSTHGEVNEMPVFSETLSTNSVGRLKPHAPELTAENPDYSYKVEYLGLYK